MQDCGNCTKEEENCSKGEGGCSKGKHKGSKEGEVEEEEAAKNWPDAHIQHMIAMRGEMEPDFLKGAKKQGVDVWLKLHAYMIAVIPHLNRTAEACKKKFNALKKAYVKDKMADGISGSDRKECKFYDDFDQWFNQAATVIKYVTALANDSTCAPNSSSKPEKDHVLENEQASKVTTTSSLKGGKKNFQEQTFALFTHMAESSTIMVKNFKKINTLMENVSSQMERLIEKW